MTETRKITLQFPSLRAFLAEYGERISADGMLLRGESPPAAGSTVDIEVVVAAGMRLLRARGETLWSGATGTGSGQQAAAVRFRELDEASRKLIGKIVDQRRREGAELFSLADVPGPREARLRDLTVAAAAISAEPVLPVGAPADAIFDLAEPPEASASDLFSPVEGGETVPSPPAVAAEPTATRKPVPPVPLLADPGPAPFDLAPAAATGGEEAAAAGLHLETNPEAQGEAAPAAQVDLSDLFGGDEPAMAPASGRTEAFPPSFVDEVEAELEAAELPQGSYLEVDTGELEVQLGGPVDEPERASSTPAEQPIEPTPTAPIEVEPPTAPSFEVEPAIASSVEAEPEPEPPSGREISPSRQELSPQVASAFSAAQGPETVEIPILDSPAPVAAGPAREPSPAPREPAPVAEAPRPAAQEVRPVSEPVPPIEPPPPALDGASTEAAAPPAVEASSPAVGAPPPVEMPPQMDDNLLSIPELSLGPSPGEPRAAPEAPEAPGELPSSAQSLRGAAGRSRHLGTWLLIALLAGALAVAGYFIMGLVRAGGAPPQQDVPADTSAPRVATPAPTPDEAPAPEAVETTTGEGASAGEVEPATAGAAAGGEAQAEPAPPEPPAPLTGLNRITWSETDTETVLALVGDGEISRQDVELAPIAGDQPRLVIKISGVQRAFQPAVLEVGTAHVERVRTGLHAGGQLHVVVDLAAAGVSVRDLVARGPRLEVRLGAE